MDVALWSTGSGTEGRPLNLEMANYEHQSAILVKWIVKATNGDTMMVIINLLKGVNMMK